MSSLQDSSRVPGTRQPGVQSQLQAQTSAPAQPPREALGDALQAAPGASTHKAPCRPPLHPATGDVLRRAFAPPAPAPRRGASETAQEDAAWCRQARAYQDGQRPAKAEPLLGKLLSRQHNQRDVGLLLDLATCLLLQGKERSSHPPFLNTQGLLATVMQLNPQDPAHRQRLGYALFLGLQRAHFLGSLTPTARAEAFAVPAAYLQEALERENKARRQTWARGQLPGPKSADLHEVLGACEAARGQHRRAEALFGQARVLHDRLPPSHMRLRAFALAMQGLHRQAEGFYRLALAAVPNDASTRGELGVALVAQHGECPEAQRLLERAVKKFPGSTRYAQALAQAQPQPRTRGFWGSTLRALKALLPPEGVVSGPDDPF